MRKRYLYASGVVLLAILLTLVVWQVSFNFGEYGPSNAAQTFALWAVSTLIIILTVTLGFMLFRTGVKLYLEHQSNREGSHVKSRLVLGALALSLLPVVFLVVFGYAILNRTIDKWFSRPAEGIRIDLIDTGVALGDEVQGRAQALANGIAARPDVLAGTANFAKICSESRIAELRLQTTDGPARSLCQDEETGGELFTARAALGPDTLVVRLRPAVDLAGKQSEIQRYVREYDQLAGKKNSIRRLYMLLLLLIARFILFVATWIALLLSRQIGQPITA